MTVLSMDSEQILSDMYDSFRYEVSKLGKHSSIWEFIFNVKNNNRYDVLYKAAGKYIPDESVSELMSNDFIRPSKDAGEYIITAKGVSYIESVKGINTFEDLINLIDERYFKIDVKKVSPREKIILFSMLMVRCFSESCCIDARKDNSVKDYWMQIFINAQNELKRLGVIDKVSIEELGKDSDIEHPMSNIIRHTDGLDTKVKMLYKKTGRNQYYLDVLNKEGEIDPENLMFIISIIFENKVTYDNIDEITSFCNESARNDSLYVLDINEKNFSDSDYDYVIEKAFNDYLMGTI